MRESALFLLGLLVAVSVDVARLLVYADLCASVSFVGRWNVWCGPSKEGCDGIHRGEYGRRWIPFFRHAGRKITSISGNDTILPPRSMRGVSGTRISIRRPRLVGKTRFESPRFVENFSRPLMNAMKNAGCITKINENVVTKNMFGK